MQCAPDTFSVFKSQNSLPRSSRNWSMYVRQVVLNHRTCTTIVVYPLVFNIHGYNLLRICMEWFLNHKKTLQSTLKIAIFAPNSGFEAVLAPYSNFFTKSTLKIPPYDDWPCCGPPLLPLQGTWVTEYAHNDNFSRPNLPKLASNEPNFSQNHDLCAKFIFSPTAQILIEKFSMDQVLGNTCTVALEHIKS